MEVALYIFCMLLRRMGTLSAEATLPFSFLPPFFMEINSYRKRFAPLRANSFL